MLRYTSSNPLNVTREIVRVYRRQSAGDQGVHEVELLTWEGEGLEARKTKRIGYASEQGEECSLTSSPEPN